jgi:glycosyltransferase involved in cell wall biosynthesis
MPARGMGRRLSVLLRGIPDLADRLWAPHLVPAVLDFSKQVDPDIVQVEGLELAPYLAALRPALPRARFIYDAHNAEHILQRRAFRTDLRQPRRWPAALYSLIQARRLARYEAEVCRAVDRVLCVSDEDEAALRRLDHAIATVVVPNGIELALYTPPATQPDGGTIVFTGKMDYRPNVDAALWFAGDILPRVRRLCPTAVFQIVGQTPAPAVQRLNGRGGVVVTGAVPDTRPHIAGAALYVAPLRMGGGTRFKLLEAWALERPVVATRIGAEGFPVQPGRELLLADGAADFAAAVVQLLTDRALAARLGEAGRAMVAHHYDWRKIVPRVEAVYRSIARSA